jgi:diguanylate cyclase (GGDEF)-like protein/PAS domain S-box-containing protein
MGTTPAQTTTGRDLLHLVAEGTSDLQTVVSATGEYLFVSTAGAATFGWTPADLVGQQQASLTHPDDVTLLLDAHRGLLADDAGSITTVRRLRCNDGTFRWVESRSRVDDGGEERMVVSSVRDIAERREFELDLQRQAATDPLTGIANRTTFMDRLRHALYRLERHRGLVAVLFLDLDRFKLINDSVGHHVGDAVLAQMAERLLQVLRPQDTLARLGGDEFAVVAEDLTSAEDAISFGGRIVEAARRPFVVGDEQFVCTASAGIAVTTDARKSAEGLLQEADLALYRAKDRGRDRADVFDERLRTRAVGRLGTERMLRRAIDEDRLRVHYQPIVDLATGRTVAAEALVRVWDRGRSDMITAETFIEVAEETGLLATIDDWVLVQVIEQAAAWRDQFPNSAFRDIAINVTARHLADAGFAQSVIDDLAARQLPAESLQIEVTERVLMEASNSAMSGLNVLRTAGVRVGLDDFGTGYSSLSYLRMFPLDFVKIDQSFISELTRGGTVGAIVASVIDLSHALGMAVVAEGVETAAQAQQLVALGCDRAQGYHYAAAAPPEGIEQRVLRPDVTPGDSVADEQRNVRGVQPQSQ